MLQVPNVRLVISTTALHGAKRSYVIEKPVWFKEMYMALLSGTAGSTVDVEQLPESFSDAGRYTTFGSIDTAERETITFFAGDDKRRLGKMNNMFNRLFPNGLRDLILKLQKEDLENMKQRATKRRCSPIPHPSFVGDPKTAPGPLNEFEALNVQAKGYANLGECAKITDPMVLVECGLSPAQAVEVIELAKQSRAQTEAIAKK